MVCGPAPAGYGERHLRNFNRIQASAWHRPAARHRHLHAIKTKRPARGHIQIFGCLI